MEGQKVSKDKPELLYHLRLDALSVLLVLYLLRQVTLCALLEKLQEFRSIASSMHLQFLGRKLLVRKLLIRIPLSIWNGFMRKPKKELIVSGFQESLINLQWEWLRILSLLLLQQMRSYRRHVLMKQLKLQQPVILL